MSIYLSPDEFTKPPSAYNSRNSVRAKFPPEYAIKERDDGSSLEVLDFVDAEGDVRITIRSKLLSYDCYTNIHFYSSAEIIAAREEKAFADHHKDIVDTFILLNFARKWSHQNNTVVYFFKDGEKRAKEYYGLQRDIYYRDAVHEFSEHVFIGFCTLDESERKVDTLKALITQYKYKHIGVITSRELSWNRVISAYPFSLHRYEALHMFGCDTINANREAQVCRY